MFSVGLKIIIVVADAAGEGGVIMVSFFFLKAKGPHNNAFIYRTPPRLFFKGFSLLMQIILLRWPTGRSSKLLWVDTK